MKKCRKNLPADLARWRKFPFKPGMWSPFIGTYSLEAIIGTTPTGLPIEKPASLPRDDQPREAKSDLLNGRNIHFEEAPVKMVFTGSDGGTIL